MIHGPGRRNNLNDHLVISVHPEIVWSSYIKIKVKMSRSGGADFWQLSPLKTYFIISLRILYMHTVYFYYLHSLVFPTIPPRSITTSPSPLLNDLFFFFLNNRHNPVGGAHNIHGHGPSTGEWILLIETTFSCCWVFICLVSG